MPDFLFSSGMGIVWTICKCADGFIDEGLMLGAVGHLVAQWSEAVGACFSSFGITFGAKDHRLFDTKQIHIFLMRTLKMAQEHLIKQKIRKENKTRRVNKAHRQNVVK